MPKLKVGWIQLVDSQVDSQLELFKLEESADSVCSGAAEGP